MTIQFICIFYLALSVNSHDLNLFSGIVVVFGVIIGLLAFRKMRKSDFKITPDVSKNAKLITSGIYKHIRHPMYLAVLITALGLLLMDVSFARVLVFLILIANLLVKIRYEEDLLIKRFAEYKSYKESSKKLIPYLF